MKRELLTERLHLVPCGDDHLDGLHAINADPEVMRYLRGRPESRAETAEMIERVKAHWARWGYSWWIFIDRQSGAMIGAGCIQHLRRVGGEPDPSCPLEIGWRLRRDKWGQGFATEAARAMADFAFSELGVDILYAVADPENRSSIAVMRRLGMRSRGVEDWYAHKVATYEISAEDWRLCGSVTVPDAV